MNKRLTRVLSLIMVLAMFLSVSVPAFALEDGWDREIKVIGDSSVFVDDTAGDDENAADEGEPDEGWDREISAGEIREFNADPDNDDPDPKMELFTENEELGYSVTVEAPMGALPTLAELRAEPVEIEDVREPVEELLGGDREILVALDISFWLGEDEIEPEEPVQVIITAPELEGRDDLTLVHLPEEDEPETIELIPQEDLAFELGTNEIVFQSDSFSTYVVTGEGNRRVTVHYGYMRNGAFREFDAGSSSSTTYPSRGLRTSDYSSSNPVAYLIYDFPGYTYKETRWSSESGLQIWPVMQMYNYDYYVPRVITYNNTTVNWQTVPNNNSNNVYVIYEPKVVTTGGSSSGGGDGQQPPVQVPDLPANKKVVDNGNGTFDITLSVTGVVDHQETVTKASVIVIFDTSGSMNWEMSSDNTPADSRNTRMAIAKKAVKELATALLGKTDSDGNKLVQMALISFSTTASVYNFGTENNVTPKYTSNAATFNAAVDSLSAGGITNWEQALDKANALDVPNDTPTYVIFVSDGDPTVHISRRNLSDSTIYSDLQFGAYADGDVDGVGGFNYGGYTAPSTIREGLFGYSGGVYHEEHYNAAVPAGKAILDAEKEFYTIGLSTSVTRMEEFTTDVGAPADHYFPATSQQALKDAFDKIADAVTNNLGFTEVIVDDGVTELTSVESDALTGTPTNFVYRKGTHTGDEIPQNEIWSDAPEADITDDNHVIWNTSSIGSLEPGVTYSVTFTVWPSQESYDIIADINNGIIRDAQGNIVRTGTPDEAYAAQPDSVKRQIVIKNGVYTLLTNTGVNVSYRFNGVADNKEVTDYENGSMPLDATYFGVHKDWNNGMDARTANVLTKEVDGKVYLADSNGALILDDDNNPIVYDRNNLDPRAVTYVDLIVTEIVGDQEEDYTEIRLTSEDLTATGGNGAWDWNQMFIAPGVLTYPEGATSGDLNVRETGRDYSVREKPNESYYWNLTAETYHPMIINGEACVLQKVADDDSSVPSNVKNNENTFSGDYFNIGGTVYKKLGTASDALISAVNDRRSMLYITKEVEGAGAPADAVFAIKVEMENPDGKHSGDAGYDTWYDTFWFAVQTDPKDRNSVVKEGVTVEGATAETNDNGATGFYWFDNGGSATIYLKAGQYICFSNLPLGTTYTIEELSGDKMPDGFLYKDVSSDAEANGDGLAPTKATLDKDNRKATGTIDASNSDYSVTYTNKYCGYFYVYHSSDNTVQRFLAAQNDVAVTNFNISALTREHTLYGGYYGSYAGTGASFDAAALTYVEEAAEDKGEGVKKYDGTNVRWDPAVAYTTEDGMHLTPVGGTVYYLKEVPEDTYLIPYLHYTFYTESKKIGTAWLVSDTDDYLYRQTGFLVTPANGGSPRRIADMYTQFTVTCSTGGKTQILKPTEVFNGEHGEGVTFHSPTAGYLTIARVINGGERLIKNGDKIQQYWVTPDNLLVTGKWVRTIDKGFGVDDIYTEIADNKTDAAETSVIYLNSDIA